MSTVRVTLRNTPRPGWTFLLGGTGAGDEGMMESERPRETRAMVAEEMASGDYDATAYIERGETLDAARARVLDGLLRRAEVT